MSARHLPALYVIGDAVDTSFDSGIFFGASSFRSLPDLSVATPEHSASNPFSSWMDATGQVHVSAPGSTITSLRVFDMQGRSIFQERYSGSDRISSKPITSTTGAYVIEVEMDGEIKRDRLIKQ